MLSSASQNILYFCSRCLSILPNALSSFKPNVVALEETCKKLQQSVEDLSSKIATLSASNNNLQMEIDNTSESLSSAQTNSAAVPPASSAMSIIDELADRDRRKKNIIILFITCLSLLLMTKAIVMHLLLCILLYTVVHMLSQSLYIWGRKCQINIGHCYCSWQMEMTNFC